MAAVGSLQVCAGHETGCESLVHAMLQTYKDQSSSECSFAGGCFESI